MAARDFLSRLRTTPPVAGAIIGALVAVADTVHVYKRWHWEELGSRDVPPLTFLTLFWIWMTVGYLTGLLFSSPRLGRWRAVPLMLTGPGIMATGRGMHWIRVLGRIDSDALAIAIAIAATLVASVPLAIVDFRETPRRRLPWLAALASFGAIVFCALDRPVRDWLPAGPRANDPAKRNVVLVFLDTVRYDDAFGPRGVAPHLQAWARGGVLFANAWAPAPWTIPTHHAVLTGVDPWTAKYEGPEWRYSRSAPLLSEHFRSRGYATAAVFANPILSPDANFAHGFDEFTYAGGPRVCRSGVAMLITRSFGAEKSPVCGWIRADDVTRRALGWVARSARPYFLALNYFDAHGPYPVARDCVQPALRLHDSAELEDFRKSGARNSDLRRSVHEQYRASVRCLDRSLEKLLTTLSADENTVIAVVGDHGELFGEHGKVGHGNSVYRQVLHVPLVVRGPLLGPQRIEEPVSVTDLHRTLRELAEPGRRRGPVTLLDPPSRRPVIGSYAEIVLADEKSRQKAFSVVEGNHHFIRWSNGKEALFDHSRDPEELSPGVVRSGDVVAARLREIAAHAARAENEAAAAFDALPYLNRTR